MRTSTGCHACRDRHLKCISRPGSSICERCAKAGRECRRGLTIRFRPVTSVREKKKTGAPPSSATASSSSRKGKGKKKARKAAGENEDGGADEGDDGPEDDGRTCELTWGSSQVWVRVPPAVTFAPPACTLEDLEEEAAAITGTTELSPEGGGSASTPLVDHQHGQLLPMQPPPHQQQQQDVGHVRQQSMLFPSDGASSGTDQQHQSPDNPLQVDLDSPFSGFGPPTGRSDFTHSSGTDVAVSAGAAANEGPMGGQSDLWRSPSRLYQPAATWPLKSEHEARLFHHYVRNLGAWVDCCDEKYHFATDVPQRAVNYPVIANAILALASRHLARVSGAEDIESAEYMSECLRTLIPVLDDPLGVLDENLLAAIVILRLYEEMDDIDEKCHLYGGTRLLNSIADFVPSGGLGEAASWIFLRQDIYVSLTTGQPLNIDLDIFRKSPSFASDAPSGWANRMVFIFAEILDYACQQKEMHSLDTWRRLADDAERWNDGKPWHFRPLWIREETTPFPEIWMTLPSHVVGQQYYSLAKIVLGTFDPRLSRLGFGSHKIRKASESSIIEHLRIVIGLAISNEGVPAAMFHASHILCACGSYLEDQRDREAAIEFMLDVERKIGWRSQRIINSLKEQWQA